MQKTEQKIGGPVGHVDDMRDCASEGVVGLEEARFGRQIDFNRSLDDSYRNSACGVASKKRQKSAVSLRTRPLPSGVGSHSIIGGRRASSSQGCAIVIDAVE